MRRIPAPADRPMGHRVLRRRTPVAAGVALLLASLPLAPALAQAPERPRPPRPPIDLGLDANGDEVIDAAEIANAPAALRKLDRNGDGRLTPDEYRRSRPADDLSPSGGKLGERKPR